MIICRTNLFAQARKINSLEVHFVKFTEAAPATVDVHFFVKFYFYFFFFSFIKNYYFFYFFKKKLFLQNFHTQKMTEKHSPKTHVWVVDLTGDDDGDGGFIEYRIKVAVAGGENHKRMILLENDEHEAKVSKIVGEDFWEEVIESLDDMPFLPSDSPLQEVLLDDTESDEEEKQHSSLRRSPHITDFSTDSSYADDEVVMIIPPPACARRLDFERIPPSTPPPDILNASKWVFEATDWPHVENLEKEIDNPSALVRHSHYPSSC